MMPTSRPGVSESDSMKRMDGLDVIAHINPTHPSTATLNFSSHILGPAVFGALDEHHEQAWKSVPVPHLTKSKAIHGSHPGHTIRGGAIRSAMMVCKYHTSTLGSGSASPSLNPAIPERDLESIDHNTSSATNTPLNAEHPRLVVLTNQAEGGAGQLRLYDPVTHILWAIINLDMATEVKEGRKYILWK